MSSSPSLAAQDAASRALPTAVEQAFTALATYDRGSSRAVLLPIDEAVAQSKKNERTRNELESRLVAILRSGSEIARDFACVKLATIGTEASVTALTALLANPRLATSARTALEAIPSERASKALREALNNLEGLAKVGAILSLGTRRDTGSTRVLAGLLRSTDAQMQSVAAAALGEIGSAKAAEALRAFVSTAPTPARPKVADACLVCAERLVQQRRNTDAAALYSAVEASNPPRHILKAARSGLARCQKAAV